MDENIRAVRLEQCPTCASARIAKLLSPPPDEVRFRDFALFRCDDCHTAFVNPRPIDEDIPKLYVSREYGMDLGTRSGFSYWMKSTKLRLYYPSVLAHSKGKALAVLDYGCGDGMLAAAIARYGARDGRVGRVVASDFASELPPALRSWDERAAAPTYVPMDRLWDGAHAKSFDVIVLRHVLEHTPVPAATLARLAGLARPGGIIVVEIPNFDSPWRKLFRSHYCQLGIPQHLVLFDERAFRQALEPLERDGVLSLRELRGANIPVLGSSLAHVLTRKFDNIGPAAAALYPAQLVVDAISGQRTALKAYLEVR